MDAQRLADLLHPFLDSPLSESQTADISTYIDIMLRWNDKLNLTSVRDPEQIVTRHFGESLFTARCLFQGGVSALSNESEGAASKRMRVVDVGSGAGFPGLPIKIAVPAVQLTLIESNQKKATFLREVVRSLKLAGTQVFAGRAEDFPGSSADVVIMRAVEHFESVLPIAARIGAPGGRMGLLIGESQISRASALATGFRWHDPIPVPMSASRLLLIGTNAFH